MKLIRRLAFAGVSVTCLAFSSAAFAQAKPENQQNAPSKKPKPRHKGPAAGTKPGTTTTTSAPSVTQQPVPPPRSYNEPPPPVGEIRKTPERPIITREAGIGGTQAYSRMGVLELGGSTGLSRASNFTQFNISPSVGWFFMDNIELSGIVGINYVDTASGSSTFMTFLAEPSVHLPVSDYVFPFLGVGAGLAYANGPGAGLAIAPRAGVNVLVGRSGVLTPALTFVYNTASAVPGPTGSVNASAAYGMNVGYTVMW